MKALFNPFVVLFKKEVYTIKDYFVTKNYDKKFNIITSGASKKGEGEGKLKDGVKYTPTSYLTLKEVFDYLDLKEDNILLDLGCGKGRVSFFGFSYGIKKAIGVDICNVNLKNCLLENKDNIKFLGIDASDYKLSDENVVFMFNPFGWKTLKKVLANIKESLKNNPRKLNIIYKNPIHRLLFDLDNNWKVIKENSEYVIFQNII